MNICKNKKLLLVDGHALLFQSFFGMPRKIQNKHGQFVEAVVCFMGILFKTIKQLNPDNLLVVFDGENCLERKEIDCNYKANREDYSCVCEKDNPFGQLEIIKKVLDYSNIKWAETTNCEADDLIASIVNDNKTNLDIIISSPDKDFYQLIDDNVCVFTYRGKQSKLWTSQEILNKYGFEAKFFATQKALVGDASDNIKGIYGIGPVKAKWLINNFGNIDGIYSNLENMDKNLAGLLLENKQRVLNNFKIIELASKCGLGDKLNFDFVLPNKSVSTILKEIDII